MADMHRRPTQALVARKIRADLPDWIITLTGSEIHAVSPAGIDPQVSLNRIKGTTHEMGLQVIAVHRQGRLLVTIDLSEIPSH